MSMSTLLYTPSGPRNVGMPDSLEIPAPVRKTIRGGTRLGVGGSGFCGSGLSSSGASIFFGKRKLGVYVRVRVGNAV